MILETWPRGRGSVAPGADFFRPDFLPPSVLSHPRRWLLGVLLLSAPFLIALAGLEIRTDGEALYPSGNPVIEATLRDREGFRDPEQLILLVSPEAEDGTIFNAPGLAKIASLTRRLEEVPGISSEEIVSLSTMPDVTASEGAIRISRFLAALPERPDSITALKARLEEGASYRGLLYGKEEGSAALFLPLSKERPRTETLRRIRTLLDQTRDRAWRVSMTGPVAAEVLLGELLLDDLAGLVPLVILVIALLLFLCLKSPAGVIVPLSGVLIALVWTFGTMSFFGVPLTIVTSVLPVLIIAIAVTDEIYMLERFQSHLSAGMERKEALARSFREVGGPIIGASLTTAIGELAFTTASIPAMRAFGYFGALGILIAMGLSFTFVPALCLLVPRGWFSTSAPREPKRRLIPLERWAGSHPTQAAALAAVLVVAGALGIPRLEIQDSWVDNFDPSSEIASAAKVFDQSYWGSYRLDVTLESPDSRFFSRPAGVALLDSLERSLGTLPGLGGTRSVTDLLRGALRGLDSDEQLRDLDEDEIAQLLLLLEMSGRQKEIEQLVKPSGGEARILCYVRGADYTKATRLVRDVESIAAGPSERHGLSLNVRGDLAVAMEVVRSTVTNQLRSVGFSLVGLGVLLLIAYRSARASVTMLVPVIAMGIVLFGAMGYAGVSLGIATSMFSAVAIGAGIDFAIHFVSRYAERRRSESAGAAVESTFISTGRAMRWNAIVLMLGFLVLGASKLKPDRALGILLAGGIGVSYLMSCLCLPFLLTRFERRTGAGGSGAHGSALESDGPHGLS